MRARTLLRIWVPVALLVALSVAAAFVYVSVAPKRYAARAEVLVLPVPASDMRYQGLPVLRDEGGHAAVQTAAKLVATSALADAVRARLGLGETSAELLSRVTVGPSGNSSTLSIRASASSAALAARIANAFADLLLAVRTATLNGAIADATARTTQTLAALPPSDPQVPALRARLASLDALHGSTDPSLQVAGRATPPKQPTSPPRTAILLGALLGSLLLGTAAGLAATWRRWKEAYDRAVSERMAVELEQRIGARMETQLGQLQEQLAEKSAHETAEREQALDERVRVVTALESEVGRRAGELSGQEKALKERERELDKGEREVATRQRELDARADELTRRAEELEKLAAAAAARPEPEVETAASNVAELPRPPAEAGRWNLEELARTVEQRGPEFPERLDEWNSYLFFLRNYAEPDGTVPSSFDWLIEETFSDLLAS